MAGVNVKQENGERYTLYAGAAGMLLHKNGKFTMDI
jgi:hypothetical protein